MRVEHFARFSKHLGDGFTGLGVIHGQRVKQAACFGPAVFFNAEVAAVLEGVHQACNRCTVAPMQIEQQAFEVRGHHDVHRRGQGRVQGVFGVLITAHEAVQDVVTVGGNDQLVDRQPHVACQVTGEDVTKVTGRHRERDGALRPAQLQRCMEVVNDLGHDPRPVDRVNRHQARAFQEALIGKTGFDHFLAVIEVTFNGDVVNVVAEECRHLTTLHF